MRNSILLFLMVFATEVYAQDQLAIKKVLGLWDDASDVSGMVDAAIQMRSISDEMPDTYLPAYWTAFYYSQVGRQANQINRNAMEFYDSAQVYLDRAHHAKAQMSALEKSDHYALQSLIYNLKAGAYWSVGDNQNGTDHVKKSSTALNQAIKEYDSNPRVYLLGGTDLVSNGLRLNNSAWIIAGREMLVKAKALYGDFKPASDIAPSWGSSWINFWISRAKLD